LNPDGSITLGIILPGTNKRVDARVFDNKMYELPASIDESAVGYTDYIWGLLLKFFNKYYGFDSFTKKLTKAGANPGA
jgi:hypothetical protein